MEHQHESAPTRQSLAEKITPVLWALAAVLTATAEIASAIRGT